MSATLRGKPEGATRSRRSADFEFLVLSLGGTWDPALPIAASRAGATGLLDLSFLTDASHARRAVERLTRLARGRFGVVLDGRSNDVEAIALEALGRCDTILFSALPSDLSSDSIARARRVGSRIGVVCNDGGQAPAAEHLGVDFIVAKGHEAGGLVGEETSFVLVQRLIGTLDIPVFAWGGIGRSTAAACFVAGASGVCLDWQFALTRESPLSGRMRKTIAAMDGSETVALPCGEAGYFRVLDSKRQNIPRRIEPSATPSTDGTHADSSGSVAAVSRLLASGPSAPRLMLVGQDAAFASDLSRPGEPAARSLSLLREALTERIVGCGTSCVTAEGSPLARSHGTRYPIVQGPMTRVSDVPEFCRAVADGGGLPSVALGVMGRDEALSLLQRTRELMKGRPWSVGVLGFLGESVRAAQLSAIEEVRPPYAIIAGGRPDQAAALEAVGVPSYLHVPSPELLRLFLAEGARRFVFEGRECGGHVGPRTSFVLWESQIRVLLEAGLTDEEMARVHVLFAGGIHDARSAAMVGAAAQGLAARNMKVGVLMGSAYLFTREIVECGAVSPSFQDIALESTRTVLLESGSGHSIRCAPTPYTQEFAATKRRLEEASERR